MKNMCGIEIQLRPVYRAPLGSGNVLVVRYPGRWGLNPVGWAGAIVNRCDRIRGGYRGPSGRWNRLIVRHPGRCPGLRNDGPLGLKHGADSHRRASANGAPSLSPGHRPGSVCRNVQRPEGPRHGAHLWRGAKPPPGLAFNPNALPDHGIAEADD